MAILPSGRWVKSSTIGRIYKSEQDLLITVPDYVQALVSF